MIFLKKSTLIVLFSFIAVAAFAIPANPYPVSFRQADGSMLTIRLHGDEFSHYATTADGYVVFRNEDGNYVYAERSTDGELVPSKVIAKDVAQRSKSDLAFLKAYKPHENFGEKAKQKAKAAQEATLKSEGQAGKVYPNTGAPRGLVILVNFADLKFTVPNARENFTRMLNEEGYSDNGAFGSARDYFKESSMGKFAPIFDVFGPYDLPKGMSTYGGETSNARAMVVDACRLAFENGVNFANYDVDNDGLVDNVFVYYAGFNQAETDDQSEVWPHRYNVDGFTNVYNGKIVYDYACTSERTAVRDTSAPNPYRMCGIGTFCHEFSHVLGLPDLYNASTGGQAIYDHTIMDYGGYSAAGKCPPTYSAYERFASGWLTPKVLKTPADVVDLAPLNTSNEAYVFSSTDFNMSPNAPNPTIYYFIENRQQTGFDRYLPGHGLLFWHVLYNRYAWSINRVNQYADSTTLASRVAPEPADKLMTESTQAGDYFPGSTNETSFKSLYDVLKYVRVDNITEDPIAEGGHVRFRFMGGSNGDFINVSTGILNIDHNQNATATFDIDVKSTDSWTISQQKSTLFQLSKTSGTGPATITVKNLTPGGAVVKIDSLFVKYTGIIRGDSVRKLVEVRQSASQIEQRCGWTSNYSLATDTLYDCNLGVVMAQQNCWGQYTGNNNFYMLEMAEFFQNDGERILDSFAFRPIVARGAYPDSKIVFRVYAPDAEKSTMPGVVLAEKEILLKDIKPGNGGDSLLYFAWGSDLVVNGNFFLGYNLQYDKVPMDSFALTFASNRSRNVQTSTAVTKYKWSWMNFSEFEFVSERPDLLSFNMALCIDVKLRCTQSDNVAPVVSLLETSNTTDTTVVLHANLERSGSARITERGFMLGTSADNITSPAPIASDVQQGKYEMQVEGVKDSKIYYKAYATNADGVTVYSSVIDSVVFGVEPPYLTVSPTVLYMSSRSFGESEMNILTNQSWSIISTTPWVNFSETTGTNSQALKAYVAQENTDTLHGRTDTVLIQAGNLTYRLPVVQDVRLPFAKLTLINDYIARSRTGIKVTANVLSDGNGIVSERGFYYSFDKNVDTNTSVKVPVGSGVGSYTTIFEGLPIDTFVYFTAYAYNEYGFARANPKSVKTVKDPSYLQPATSLFQVKDTAKPYLTTIVKANVVWRASTTDSWLSLDTNPTCGDGSVKIQVLSANTATSGRVGTITLVGEKNVHTINVFQAGTEGTATFQVSPTTLNFVSPRDSVATINIFTNGDWTITDLPAWMRVKPANGTGIASVKVSADISNSVRTGSFAVNSGVDKATITVNQAVKAAQAVNINLTINPNPVQTSFVVNAAGLTIKKINVMDVMGKEYTARYEKHGQEFVVFVEHLTPGMYFVQVETTEGIAVEKFVKQ